MLQPFQPLCTIENRRPFQKKKHGLFSLQVQFLEFSGYSLNRNGVFALPIKKEYAFNFTGLKLNRNILMIGLPIMPEYFSIQNPSNRIIKNNLVDYEYQFLNEYKISHVVVRSYKQEFQWTPLEGVRDPGNGEWPTSISSFSRSSTGEEGENKLDWETITAIEKGVRVNTKEWPEAVLNKNLILGETILLLP